jgi:hypothetical protein
MELLKNVFFIIVSAGLTVFCVLLLIQNILLLSSFGKVDVDFQRKTAVRLEQERSSIKTGLEAIYRKQISSFKDTADKLAAEKQKSRGLEDNLKNMPRIPGEDLKK